MLRILEEQMDHFGRRAAKDFEERLLAHIAEVCPEAPTGTSLDELRARVRDGMARAERYGITMEPDAARFILMLLALDPGADEELPWVRAIVNDRGLDGGGKVRLLETTGRRVLRGAEEGA